MREYGKVYTAFWASPTIRNLSDDGRTLALYLLTCPHSTIAGVFRLPDGYASEDLGWPAGRVREGFVELFANGFANRCETTKWVWIDGYLKWNQPENPNQRKAAKRLALSVPAGCSWKPVFMRAVKGFLAITDEEIANCCGTLPKPLPNQDQEQEQEQDDLNHQGCLENSARVQFSAPLDDYPPDCPLDGTSLAAQMAVVLRRELRHGTNAKPDNPVIVEWAASGVTTPQLLNAARLAINQKPGESVPVRYIDKILKSQQQEQDHAERRRRSKSAYDPIIEAQQILRRQAQLEREAREHGQPGVAG